MRTEKLLWSFWMALNRFACYQQLTVTCKKWQIACLLFNMFKFSLNSNACPCFWFCSITNYSISKCRCSQLWFHRISAGDPNYHLASSLLTIRLPKTVTSRCLLHCKLKIILMGHYKLYCVSTSTECSWFQQHSEHLPDCNSIAWYSIA